MVNSSWRASFFQQPARSARERRERPAKLRQRCCEQRSAAGCGQRPQLPQRHVRAVEFQAARGKLRRGQAVKSCDSNSRRPQQAGTQCSKRAAGTGPSRPYQRLRRRSLIERHQNRHAADGDAAGHLRDRARADSRSEPEQLRGSIALRARRSQRDLRRRHSQRLVQDSRFRRTGCRTIADGLQLSTFAFATWKFQPVDIERIDILRGPSAVLYGGSGPGGLVNVISKTPGFEPSNYAEAGVNSYGNRYLSFDFTGPAATPSGPSNELYYRLLGTVKGGDTQTDFTPDNTYFVAPSVTYKPDADTTLTILASASKNETRVQGFLPYVGTVVNAPFGRIPTQLFASDPSVDSFSRE